MVLDEKMLLLCYRISVSIYIYIYIFWNEYVDLIFLNHLLSTFIV